MKLNILLPFAFAFAVSAAYADPVVNIDAHRHPNLNEAQKAIVQAYKSITVAQKDNRYDMHGEASKAKELLEEADKQLKAAALTANAAGKK